MDPTVLLDAAQEVELPSLMAVAGDKADSSVSSLYDADFSGAAIKACQVWQMFQNLPLILAV